MDQIVHPDECFVSYKLLDVGAINKYFAAVILFPISETYFANLANISEFVHTNIHFV